MCLECILTPLNSLGPTFNVSVWSAMLFLWSAPKKIFVHKISVAYSFVVHFSQKQSCQTYWEQKGFPWVGLVFCHIKLDIKCIEFCQSVLFKHTVSTSESSQPRAHVSVYSNRIFQILTQFRQMLITFVFDSVALFYLWLMHVKGKHTACHTHKKMWRLEMSHGQHLFANYSWLTTSTLIDYSVKRLDEIQINLLS